MLEVKQIAPDFRLKDKQGREVFLTDFRGKRVVLYFYPRDNTPGCTRQACGFARIQKYNLPFLLLSDPDLTAIRAYDVWKEKKLYGKVSMGVQRTTFLIDAEGRIEKIISKVKPDVNAQEVLEYYKEKR
mgnify:CR=1 FL=1